MSFQEEQCVAHWSKSTKQPEHLVWNEEAIPKASNFEVEVGEDRSQDATADTNHDGRHHRENVHLYVLVDRE